MRVLHVSPVRKLEHGIDTEDLGLAHCFLIGYVLKNVDFPIEFQIVHKNILETMYDFKPDIVAISAMTYNFHDACLLASKAKEIGSMVIVGGHHLSMLHNHLTDDMDVGVISEGEDTYLELINLYHRGKWGPEYWKNVKGIAFHTPENQIYVTPPRPLVKDLDSVGHPVREFSPITPSVKEAIVTSRGCPYNCIFCSQTRFWGNKLRFHSPEYVIKEIERVHNFSKTDRIRLDDSLFLINKKRLSKIIELWEKHPLYGRIIFNCAARANLIDDEMAQLAKRMMIDSVFFGFESNNADSLAYLKGARVTPEDNQRAYDILTSYKIRVHGDFIIGVPEETKEQIMDTYEFIILLI